MNLVNNGKFEEKYAHSFKFFDIKKKRKQMRERP
jgi:hypothetical protein